jgi:hypothetical protein
MRIAHIPKSRVTASAGIPATVAAIMKIEAVEAETLLKQSSPRR